MAADVDIRTFDATSATEGGHQRRRPPRRRARRQAAAPTGADEPAANAAPTPPNRPRAGRRPCAPAGVRRHFGRSIASAIAASTAASRSAQSIGWTRKCVEIPAFELGRVDSLLRPDQLQLVARALDDLGPRLRADAQPVDAPASPASVPLLSTATLKPALVQRLDQRRVELEHRLAAGDHHQPFVLALAPQPPRPARPARPRAANLPPPSPSVPTKSVSQKLHCARSPGPARAPTTDCSRQSAGTPPGCPPAPPRPEASGSIP